MIESNQITCKDITTKEDSGVGLIRLLTELHLELNHCVSEDVVKDDPILMDRMKSQERYVLKMYLFDKIISVLQESMMSLKRCSEPDVKQIKAIKDLLNEIDAL